MFFKLRIIATASVLLLTMSCSNSSDSNKSPAQETPPVNGLSEGYTELPSNYDDMTLEKLTPDMTMYFKANQTVYGTVDRKSDQQPLNEITINLFQTDVLPNVHTKSCFLTLKTQSSMITDSITITFNAGWKFIVKSTDKWSGGNAMNMVVNFAPSVSYPEAFMVCTDYFSQLKPGQVPQAMTVGDVRNGMKNSVSFASKK